MRVNTQFPIAVHTLMLVAAFGEEQKVTSDLISGSTGINPVLIRNVFTKLRKAGLLLTAAGRGRTRLAKPAADITLWDVYTAVESGSAKDIFKVHPNISPVCPVGRLVFTNLTARLEDAVAAMRAEMSKTTLATLLKDLETNCSEK